MRQRRHFSTVSIGTDGAQGMARDRFIQAKKDWDAGQIDEPAWQSIRIKTDAALLFYVEIHPKSSD
jgi:hypothetical protein